MSLAGLSVYMDGFRPWLSNHGNARARRNIAFVRTGKEDVPRFLEAMLGLEIAFSTATQQRWETRQGEGGL